MTATNFDTAETVVFWVSGRSPEPVIRDDPTVYRTSNAVYQELVEGILTGRIDAKRVYLDDRPGELDPTLCIPLDAAPCARESPGCSARRHPSPTRAPNKPSSLTSSLQSRT
jgi:hypothetical protein